MLEEADCVCELVCQALGTDTPGWVSSMTIVRRMLEAVGVTAHSEDSIAVDQLEALLQYLTRAGHAWGASGPGERRAKAALLAAHTAARGVAVAAAAPPAAPGGEPAEAPPPPAPAAPTAAAAAAR